MAKKAFTRKLLYLFMLGALVVALVLIEWRAWGMWLSGDPVKMPWMSTQHWGRLGKLLQFVAGLTVLLDLAGKSLIRSWHTKAKALLIRTGRQLRPDLLRTVNQWPTWISNARWVAIPLCSICLGVAFYWVQVDLLEFSHSFAVWAAPIVGLLAFLYLFGFPGFLIHGLVLTAIVLVGYIRFGVPDVEALPWWQYALLDKGGWILPSLLAGALVYLAIMFVVLLVALLLRLTGASLMLTVTAPLVWALDREAHPLRWLAFTLFVTGFTFDLLAS